MPNNSNNCFTKNLANFYLMCNCPKAFFPKISIGRMSVVA